MPSLLTPLLLKSTFEHSFQTLMGNHMYEPLSHTLVNKVSTTRSKSRHFPYNFTSKPFPDHYLMHVLQHVAAVLHNTGPGPGGSVMRVGSDTFGYPIFQKGLQN